MMFQLIVTLASLLIAAIMSLVAWRVAGEERRRSDARVRALAADIHAVPAALRRVQQDFELHPAGHAPAPSARNGPNSLVVPREARLPGAREALLRRAPGADFCTAPQPPGSIGRRTAAIAVGALLVASTLALAVGFGSRKPTHPASTNVAADTTAQFPLELVELVHERDGDRLTVRGVVRNPVAARSLDRLTAQVFLFNRDGGFLGSGGAAVESSVLAPGGQAIFVVALPGASEVERYRVSFRTDDRIVPHVDRRSRS
jgi:hypothetical protein